MSIGWIYRIDFAALAKRDRPTVIEMARRGWFYGPRMTANLPLIQNAIDVLSDDEVDEYFARHFRQHLDDIESVLVESYPRRSQILKDAFWAHRLGKYTLSIPPFIAQADGIMQDSLKMRLYQREMRNGIKGRKQMSETLKCRLEEETHTLGMVLSPLVEEAEKSQAWVDSRNDVLHGSYDYLTEVNSLKAVSLLDYIHHWVINSGEPSDR